MREIITLQLGRQSNYVAAHFWNAQVGTTPQVHPKFIPSPSSFIFVVTPLTYLGILLHLRPG